MRSANKLSAAEVVSKSKPGCYADGLGLYLQVMPSGSKSWLFRFMRDGQARKMGLGPTHTVTLKMAREKALDCRRKLLEGVDPINERQGALQARKLEKMKGVTFKEAGEKYIAAHRSGWKSAKHAGQWTSTLETYAYPVFGSVSVAAVDVGLVLKCLEPIWQEKTETASRLRGRIESILDWAKARHYRQGENPARWKGHLENLLPAKSRVRSVEHHPALPYAEIGTFMAELRAREGVGPLAFEFAILCASRTSEALGAEWSEIDMAAKLWTIPAQRMKSKKPHRVPLAERALDILRGVPREDGNPFVFIGDRKGRGLNNTNLLHTLKRMERFGITAHGFRSTFRDWAAETTAYPSDLVEIALAHTQTNKVEAAYKRGDQMEKRRRLMNDWAAFCAMPARTGEVVPIRG